MKNYIKDFIRPTVMQKDVTNLKRWMKAKNDVTSQTDVPRQEMI